MSSDYQLLLYERSDATVTITMNRPDQRNVLSLGLLEELNRAFNEAGRSDATGVILAGNGKVFSAGHDFAEMAGASLQDTRQLFATCTQLMNTGKADSSARPQWWQSEDPWDERGLSRCR